MGRRAAALSSALLTALFGLTGSGYAADPFIVRTVDAPSEVTLGMGVTGVARIINISGKPQPVAYLHASLRLHVVDGPSSAMHCLETSYLEGDPSSEWDAPVPDLGVNRRRQVPVGWTTDVERGFLPPEPGKYTVVFSFRMTQGKPSKGEPEHLWTGEVSSDPVTIQVVEPSGVDAEAFEHYSNLAHAQYSCSRARRFTEALSFPPRTPDRSDVLRRYPDSIYAAEYVVKQLLQMGTKFPPADATVSKLGRDIQDLHGRVPCPPPDLCLEDGTVYLRGADYLRWKLGWCERILERHPKVWFADGVRYAAATYRFQLGDKAGCAAQLRDLAEHGRPYVATKAGELLTAMQAKGMLEEKAK